MSGRAQGEALLILCTAVSRSALWRPEGPDTARLKSCHGHVEQADCWWGAMQGASQNSATPSSGHDRLEFQCALLAGCE